MENGTEPLYTVRELAELLVVPRTTINDWLAKYQQYAEFTSRGKRKVYTERTLKLLRQIAECRDRELTSGQIEELLGQSHPLQGEALGPTAGGGGPIAGANPDTGPKTTLPAPTEPAPPTLAARHLEAIELLNVKFAEINERLERLRQAEEQAAARTGSGWRVAVAALAIVFLATVSLGIWWTVRMEKAIAEEEGRNRALTGDNRALSERLTLTSEETAALRQDLRRQEELLTKRQEAYDRAAKESRETLATRQAAFEQALKELRKDAEKARIADALTAREKFAAEQLAWLRKLETGDAEAKRWALALATTLTATGADTSRSGSPPAVAAPTARVETDTPAAAAKTIGVVSPPKKP